MSCLFVGSFSLRNRGLGQQLRAEVLTYVPSSTVLPFGWEEAYTEDGHKYYIK